MSTFNTRFSAAIRSYRNSGLSLMNLMVEAIDYADENNHNPVYIQKILDGVEGGDVAHMSTIVTSFAPFYVKDGVAKLKGKKQDRSYCVDRAMVSSVKSFRSLAMALTPETANKPAWDVDKAAMAFAKACRKAELPDSAAHAAITRAFVSIDQDIAAKEIADEVKRVAKIVKLAA